MRTVDFLRSDEIRRLRRIIDTGKPSGLRMRALIEFLLSTGCRIGEALAVNRTEIDWERRELIITNFKAKRRELVLITPKCIFWLKKYLASRLDLDPALFYTEHGTRMKAVTARYYMMGYSRMLGRRVYNHLFRKTFGTHLILNGVDIRSAQTLLRHKSPVTTLGFYVGLDALLAKKSHTKAIGNL